MLDAHHNVHSHEEVFVEYGNLANFPISILFKAITHYYPQIVTSPHDRELWSRIPQARYLFNAPYHTLQPSQVPHALAAIQYHHNHCER